MAKEELGEMAVEVVLEQVVVVVVAQETLLTANTKPGADALVRVGSSDPEEEVA